MEDLNLTGKTWIAALEEDKSRMWGERGIVLKLFISFISGFISAQLRIL